MAFAVHEYEDEEILLDFSLLGSLFEINTLSSPVDFLISFINGYRSV